MSIAKSRGGLGTLSTRTSNINILKIIGIPGISKKNLFLAYLSLDLIFSTLTLVVSLEENIHTPNLFIFLQNTCLNTSCFKPIVT